MAFSLASPSSWNILPPDLCMTSSFFSLVFQLKCQLFRDASSKTIVCMIALSFIFFRVISTLVHFCLLVYSQTPFSKRVMTNRTFCNDGKFFIFEPSSTVATSYHLILKHLKCGWCNRVREF